MKFEEIDQEIDGIEEIDGAPTKSSVQNWWKRCSYETIECYNYGVFGIRMVQEYGF